MNSRQAAATLLRRLNLPEGTANVVVDDQHDPAELTVLVFCPPKPMLVVDEWEGHPVRILFTGAPPMAHLH